MAGNLKKVVDSAYQSMEISDITSQRDATRNEIKVISESKHEDMVPNAIKYAIIAAAILTIATSAFQCYKGRNLLFNSFQSQEIQRRNY